MRSKLEKIKITTKKQFDFVDITEKVKESVLASKILNGTVTIFTPHTTASVRINHNEPLLLQDILSMFYRLAPLDINYSHDFYEIRSKIGVSERSNGHSHVMAFLLGSSETIPVSEGQPTLGAKQSVFLVELDGGRERTVVIQVMGE